MSAVRAARVQDLPRLLEIEQAGFTPAQAATKESLQARFAVFPENFLVLEKAGLIRGMVNGMSSSKTRIEDQMYEEAGLHEKNGRNFLVFSLCVYPDDQKQGYGRQLMEELERICQSRGMERIELTCEAKNLAFYERLGFENQGISASVHGATLWYDMEKRI